MIEQLVALVDEFPLITSIEDGAQLRAGENKLLKGIAFDGGYGITEVLFSPDGGKSWREAELGKDLGKYSFREWSIAFTPPRAGDYELKVKATNRIGQSQPLEPLWNPAGYMRNVVETMRVKAVVRIKIANTALARKIIDYIQRLC